MIRPLTEKMKSLGRDIIHILDQTDDKPTSVFWFYIEDEWRLCFATMTARVDRAEDRNPIMRRIIQRISEIYKDDINIAITAPANVMIRSMFGFIKTSPDQIIGNFIHSRDRSNGDLIPFYIYRVFVLDYPHQYPLKREIQSAAVWITATNFHPNAVIDISHNIMIGGDAGIVIDGMLPPGARIVGNMMMTRYLGYDIGGLNGSNFSGNFAGRYGGYMSDESTGFKIGKVSNSKFRTIHPKGAKQALKSMS